MEIVLGVFTNIIVQLIKKYASTAPWVTWATALGLSLVGSSIYVYAKDTSFWPTLMTVLGTTGAVYTFIITRLEK